MVAAAGLLDLVQQHERVGPLARQDQFDGECRVTGRPTF
jgi:hypothetical protein